MTRPRILLVDCCYEADSLSRYEFVHPICSILERAGSSCRICHHSLIGDKDLEDCDKVVLCGTALKDNLYLDHLPDFAWLKEVNKPVLGIGSGMKIIATIFGEEILSPPVSSMGLERIEIVQSSELLGPCREIEVYHLHRSDLSMPDGFRMLAEAKHALDVEHAPEALYGPEIINEQEKKEREAINKQETKNAPEAFAHQLLPIWGLLFHPEVRNRWILENFAGI